MNSDVVTPADVPTAVIFDVRTSSFFKYHDQLPAPSEVRSQARAQWQAGTHWCWKSRRVTDGYNGHPVPVVFEYKETLLYVKWESSAKIFEKQTLYAMRNICRHSVPVPEINGWRTDGDEMLLCMEAINGRTLETHGPS